MPSSPDSTANALPGAFAGKSLAYVRRHDPLIDATVKDRYDEVVAPPGAQP